MSLRFLRLIAVVLSFATADSLSADLIRLNNGGELRGQLRSPKPSANDESLTIETLTGAVVTVAADQVQFVTRRPRSVEEYETLARQTPATAEAQWELAEWCRSRNLSTQRELHLQSVIDLDPDHEAAHRALGHIRQDGEWVDRDALMTSQGYVKYRGRYITPQELELIEKTQAERDAERDWHQKVRLWTTWLTGRHEARRAQGLAALEQIDDPNAVPAVVRYLCDEPNREMRELGVRILSQTHGDKPVKALVQIALFDAEPEIRYAALNGIAPAQAEKAVPLFVKELKHEQNVIVQRAGAALGRLGDESVVTDLINALITTHTYRVRVPGSNTPTYSFGSDGSYVDPNGLPPELASMFQSGQFPLGAVVQQWRPPGHGPRSKIVTIRHDHRNSEVLAALQKITGADYGYDERTWHLWWTAEQSGAGKFSAKKS